MASPFKDDSFQPPNWALDGAIPRMLRPWEEWIPPTPPTLPNPALRPQPAIDGYPWWVDPWTLPRSPDLVPVPSEPPLPAPPRGPNSFTDPLGDTQRSWLQSYGQNVVSQRGPINPAPEFPANGALPAEGSGGLLGILYEMMRQSEPKPDGGVDPNPQNTSHQASPERRLGRRTYRA